MILSLYIPKRGQKVTNGEVIHALFPKLKFLQNEESVKWFNAPFNFEECIQEEKYRCGQCKFLTDQKSTIGYVCGNKDKAFRTNTGKYKYKHTPACKRFESKDNL